MNSFIDKNFIKDYDNQHFLHPWEDCSIDNSDYKIINNSNGIYLFDENGEFIESLLSKFDQSNEDVSILNFSKI